MGWRVEPKDNWANDHQAKIRPLTNVIVLTSDQYDVSDVFNIAGWVQPRILEKGILTGGLEHKIPREEVDAEGWCWPTEVLADADHDEGLQRILCDDTYQSMIIKEFGKELPGVSREQWLARKAALLEEMDEDNQLLYPLAPRRATAGAA